ncbi:DUF63 family protein [uncultured Methanobrevibacter sp.]|uniref:DUF63 family protein n=1 Tax=uncultured Methanobrevibacter sp. TaxID=253161 RepID=UPI0025F62F51|nr:DUF63 family protein [uncultured Methanobrevibacter sp.]
MATIDSFLPDFIQSYFFSGYTVLNTVIYTLILVIFILAIIKLFRKIKIDPLSILYSIIPFIALGCLTRALVDNGIFPKTVFLITPEIYILVGMISIISFMFSLELYKRKNIDYRYTLFAIGLILILPILYFIPQLNVKPIIYIFATFIAASLIVHVLLIIGEKIFKNYSSIVELVSNKTNRIILMTQLFDASTTIVAVEHFNYYEQHVLPNVLNQLFDTYFTVFPMKIIVILSVLYIINQYFDDLTIKNLLKLTVFVLGLAPGLRNILTLVIGVS